MFYNNVFLFVGLKTLGTYVNFDWLDHEVESSSALTTYFNLPEGVILNHR